jgi:hypothetical protein
MNLVLFLNLCILGMASLEDEEQIDNIAAVDETWFEMLIAKFGHDGIPFYDPIPPLMVEAPRETAGIRNNQPDETKMMLRIRKRVPVEESSAPGASDDEPVIDHPRKRGRPRKDSFERALTTTVEPTSTVASTAPRSRKAELPFTPVRSPLMIVVEEMLDDFLAPLELMLARINQEIPGGRTLADVTRIRGWIVRFSQRPSWFHQIMLEETGPFDRPTINRIADRIVARPEVQNSWVQERNVCIRLIEVWANFCILPLREWGDGPDALCAYVAVDKHGRVFDRWIMTSNGLRKYLRWTWELERSKILS